MKNIIVGPAHPLRGGIANFNEALCTAFNQAGIASKIISYSLQYPDFLFPGKTQFDKGPKPASIKIESLINSVNPRTWFAVAKLIKKQNPDYIIIRYWLPFMAPCLGTIARLVKRNTSIKVIVIADNIIPHEKHMGDNLLTNYLVKSADAFIVMSESVKADLQTFLPNPKVVFLPHPIYSIFGEMHTREESLRQLNLRQTFRYILFFGFIRKYKGLDLLLMAMGDQRIKDLNLKLIVAGECYDDISFYTNIIQELELENTVIMKGDFIPANDVKNYFCAADLVVQPYRTATQSGVTQVAYHFNRPMLVTDVGGLAEIVPHQKVGYVVQPNPEAIADAIVDFYTNNREAEFSANTAIEKKRFSWISFVEGVTELYKSTLLLFLIFFALTASSQIRDTLNQSDTQGRKQGNWMKRDEKGLLIYTGTFKDNRPVGKFIYYFPKSTNIKSETQFKSNGLEAYSIIYYPNGKKMAEGKIFAEKKDSVWLYYNEHDSLIAREEYSKGIKNGKFQVFMAGGKLYEEKYYLDDLLEGPYRKFYDNGVLKENCNYHKGLHDGVAKFFYNDGNPSVVGHYTADFKDATWYLYYEDGSIDRKIEYHHSDIVKTSKYNGVEELQYDDGMPKSSITYKNGLKNGPFVEYYDLGHKQVETVPAHDEYPEDKREVIVGQKIRVKGRYLNDKFDGKITYYKEDGTIEKEEINGQR